MSDNVRFHSKWHGKNHHTLPTPGYYDSARDPIAGPGQEFMGDFYLSGAFVAITTPELSANLGAREITDILGLRSTIVGNSATWVQGGSPWTRNYSSNFITLSGDFTKVGINESDPDSNLHIKFADTNTAINSQLGEGIIIENSNTTDNNFNSIQFSGDNSVMAQVGAQFVDHSNNAGELFFTTRNSSGSRTEKMRIDKDGNVGIGAENPLHLMHVYGDSANGEIVAERSSGAKVLIQAQAANGKIGTTTNHALGFNTNDTTRVTISNAGSVGIGTANPQQKLDVTSSANGGSIPIVISNKDTTAGTDNKVSLGFGLSRNTGAFKDRAGKIQVGRELDWTSDDANIDAFMSFHLYKNNAEAEKMRIDSDGNVGIGTTEPAQKLTVAGNISAGGNIFVNAGSSSNAAISAHGTIEATGDITAFSTSDKHLKNNIVVISDPISKVQSINGVTFEWAEDAPAHLKGVDYGVIAQEIEEVLPLAVTTRDTGHKAVKYEKIIPLLIEAVKDQQKQIDELKKKLTE